MFENVEKISTYLNDTSKGFVLTAGLEKYKEAIDWFVLN